MANVTCVHTSKRCWDTHFNCHVCENFVRGVVEENDDERKAKSNQQNVTSPPGGTQASDLSAVLASGAAAATDPLESFYRERSAIDVKDLMFKLLAKRHDQSSCVGDSTRRRVVT